MIFLKYRPRQNVTMTTMYISLHFFAAACCTWWQSAPPPLQDSRRPSWGSQFCRPHWTSAHFLSLQQGQQEQPWPRRRAVGTAAGGPYTRAAGRCRCQHQARAHSCYIPPQTCSARQNSFSCNRTTGDGPLILVQSLFSLSPSRFWAFMPVYVDFEPFDTL